MIESECIICRLRQALDVCNFVDSDEAKKRATLKRVMQILIAGMDSETNEDLGYQIQDELRKITNQHDPYKNAKRKSIEEALAIYPKLVKLVRDSNEPLRTAVELSIAGNVIDFGPSNHHDINQSIDEVLNSKKSHFDFDLFMEELIKAKTILILADNAGETVFDRVLIEQLDQDIYYAVKSAPIMNDALVEDARASGFPERVSIIENGSSAAGTLLSRCSKEFINLYQSSDMVLSKGMANFETLAGESRRIFFLFKVKCGMISRKYNLPLYEYVLLDNSRLSTSSQF